MLPIYQKSEAAINDQLHTACQHLAIQTARSIEHIIERENLNKTDYRMLVTGGGALNIFLMECIQQHCNKTTNVTVELPKDNIIQFKEAILMALMGFASCLQYP